MLNIEDVDESPTIEIKVLVQFHQKNGTVKQGDFIGEFRRLEQQRIDQLVDEDEAYRNSEVLDEILVGARGVGKKDPTSGKTVEMEPAEALAWVKKTPECVGAAVTAFFRAMRPERYDEKTSKKRRRAG